MSSIGCSAFRTPAAAEFKKVSERVEKLKKDTAGPVGSIFGPTVPFIEKTYHKVARLERRVAGADRSRGGPAPRRRD